MSQKAGPVSKAFAESARAAKKLYDNWPPNTQPPYAETAAHINAVRSTLQAYAHSKNWTSAGTPIEPLPRVVAKHQETELGYILAGDLSAETRLLSSNRGAPKVGPHEYRDQCYAVAYRDAVRRNLIEDRHPIKTLCLWYGNDRSTILRWIRTVQNPFDTVFQPYDQESARTLAALTKEAGQRHQKLSRSGAAILSRNSKR